MYVSIWVSGEKDISTNWLSFSLTTAEDVGKSCKLNRDDSTLPVISLSTILTFSVLYPFIRLALSEPPNSLTSNILLDIKLPVIHVLLGIPNVVIKYSKPVLVPFVLSNKGKLW